MITRRALLAGAAPAVLAGCTATQIQQNFANFVDQVNQILRAGCGLLPGFTSTAATIQAIVAILYPGASAFVGGIAGSVQAVANAICSAVPAAPPAQLRRKLLRSSPGLPVIIGTATVNGQNVVVTGYRV